MQGRAGRGFSVGFLGGKEAYQEVLGAYGNIWE